MDEDQGIHEAGKTASQYRDEDRGKHGQLQLAALQLFEFFPVEYRAAAHAFLLFLQSDSAIFNCHR
jgi:hypothetical protein